ncbi:MAG: hypothetical protein NTV34_10120 [Proteobacteria bacterium]|nr:hypothetical protein [Pseudomonadota bacterium]
MFLKLIAVHNSILRIALPLLVLASPSRADDEVTVAIKELNRQIELCDDIDHYLEKIDRGRLKVIKESSKATLDSVNQYGLGNMNTMNLFQMQIITFKYSERYFIAIESVATHDEMAELQTIAQKIEHDRGGPFLKITNYIFTNLEKNFRELRRLTEGQPLAKEIDDLNLWAEFGNVLAISSGGDRPNAPFCEAILLYRKIYGLYGDLDGASGASPIFDLSQSIIGLTEFYREYANPDAANCH